VAGSTQRFLTIGEFSRRTGLTPKALRHYDRIGLLKPASVDPESGYRQYAEAQVAPARTIGILRSVDVPLEQVRTAISDGASNADLQELLIEHRRRIDARTTRLLGVMHRLDHLLAEGLDSAMANDRRKSSLSPEEERAVAADCFNGTWRLLEKEDRTPDDDALMQHMAHASTYHWGNVGTEVHQVRGEWQCSRVYAALGRAEPALYHAKRALDICRRAGIGDFDIAFCYEALARAYAVAGDEEQKAHWLSEGQAALDGIADDEDRSLVAADIETIP
jgi:DNA-binding transcriptional MerR regulator